MTKSPDRPIFGELPDDDPDEAYPGIVLGGMARQGSTEAIAASYRLAGDHLVDIARDSRAAYRYAYPILYLYRHSLELYLKAIVKPTKPTHNLKELAGRFGGMTLAVYGEEVPPWFAGVLNDFAEFDPDSDTFRYPSTRRETRESKSPLDLETWVDLNRLQGWMGRMAGVFEQALRIDLADKAGLLARDYGAAWPPTED